MFSSLLGEAHGKVLSWCLPLYRHGWQKCEWVAKESPDIARDAEVFHEKERFLSKEEIRQLLPECTDYIRPVVETAIHAGLRMGEVLGLRWKDIDFKRERLFVEKAADNLTKPGGWVDMNADLVALMKRLRPKGRIPAKDEYVFTFRGEHIKSVAVAFCAALRRAGIEGATFHTPYGIRQPHTLPWQGVRLKRWQLS